MARYPKRDQRKSEFSYYLGTDGSTAFLKLSKNARKGILKRLCNSLRDIVGEELVTNEWLAMTLRQDLGENFGADFLFNPDDRRFSWHTVAEIVGLLTVDPVAVQLFRSLIARGMINAASGRHYMNNVQYRKGTQEYSADLQIVGHVRIKGDKPVILQADSTLVSQVGIQGAKSVKNGTSVLHLPSGSGRVVKARPKTKG